MFTNEPVYFTSFMVQVLSCLCNVVFPGEVFVEVQSEVFNEQYLTWQSADIGNESNK